MLFSEKYHNMPGWAKWIIGQFVTVIVIVGVVIWFIEIRPRAGSGAIDNVRPTLQSVPKDYRNLQEQILQKQKLAILQEQKQQAEQLKDIQKQNLKARYNQRRQEIIKIAESELRTLQKEYQVEVAVLKNRFESIPKSQRDAKIMHWARNEWNQLNAKYTIAEERIQSKRNLDLQLLEDQMQADLQALR